MVVVGSLFPVRLLTLFPGWLWLSDVYVSVVVCRGPGVESQHKHLTDPARAKMQAWRLRAESSLESGFLATIRRHAVIFLLRRH